MEEENEAKVGVSEISEEELAEELPDAFAEVKKAIAEKRYSDAEKLLNKFEERGGEWYFQRAMLCKKRSWYLEASKSLKEAVKLDPENEVYRQEQEKLDNMLDKTVKGGGKKSRTKRKKNMGSSSGSWNDACGECCAEGLCACVCEGICEGICEGC